MNVVMNKEDAWMLAATNYDLLLHECMIHKHEAM